MSLFLVDIARTLPRPLARRSLARPRDPVQEALAGAVAGSCLAMCDPDRLHALAEDLRLVERQRLHHLGLIAVAMILSALQRSTDTCGRLLDAQAVYEQLGGPTGQRAAFRTQVAKLGPLFEVMLCRRLRALHARTDLPTLRGRLAFFCDLLVPDSSVLRLASALAAVLPGTGTDAALKLHGVYSVRAKAAVNWIDTPGSTHDNHAFWPTAWVPGALYLWDLGYEDRTRFLDAHEAGAHVLQRLKATMNPRVVARFDPARHDVPGQTFESTLRLRQAVKQGLLDETTVLDLDVEIAEGERKAVVRAVCVPVDGVPRWYLTTLPRSVFSAWDVAELYRVRWEVELFFRHERGGTRLDELRGLRTPAIIRAVVSSSLLASLMSRDVAEAMETLGADAAALDVEPEPTRPPSADEPRPPAAHVAALPP